MEQTALHYFIEAGCFLWTPGTFVSASDEDKKRICNGCGPKGFGGFVPDNILGMNATIVCNIHDWMYSECETEDDEDISDFYFRENIRRFIKTKQKDEPIKTWFRLRIADIYFVSVAVTYCGAERKKQTV